MENRRIKEIKSVYASIPLMCCCCGKLYSDEQMWEISFFNLLDNRIDPYYCCNKCAPKKRDVAGLFGATHIDTNEEIRVFTQEDFLSLFIVLLRIKEYTSFNVNMLNEYIRERLANNEYNRILSSYTNSNFFEGLKSLIRRGYIETSLKDGNLKVTINSKMEITPLLENRIEFLEEMLSFTEKYKIAERISSSSIKYKKMVKEK